MYTTKELCIFASNFLMSTINFLLDGEPESLESAVAALEPIAKEYVEKWNKEEKEQVGW